MPTENITNAVALASIVFLSIVFFIVPAVAYIFIACFNRTTEYATLFDWLLAMVGVELIALSICLIKIRWDYNNMHDNVSHTLHIFISFLWFISGFNMAACTIGANWLIEHDECKYDECNSEDSLIYYTAFSAIIMGFLEIVFAMVFIMYYSRNE